MAENVCLQRGARRPVDAECLGEETQLVLTRLGQDEYLSGGVAQREDVAGRGAR